MPRAAFLCCVDCGDDEDEINTNGRCWKCSSMVRSAAGSIAGSAGTGIAKRRPATKRRRPYSVKKRIGKTQFRGKKRLFLEMIRLGLNPKALFTNICEYMELSKLCKRFAKTSLSNFSRVWLLGRGIRGVQGLRVANKYFAKCSDRITDSTLLDFAKHFHSEYVKVGRGSSLSHREQRHHMFSGNRFVGLLRTQKGRAEFLKKSTELERFWKVSKSGSGAAFPTLQFKACIKQFKLSVLNGVIQTAKRYNSMEFARSATLISHELFGTITPYTVSIHREYIADQTGNNADFSITSRSTMLEIIKQVDHSHFHWITGWVANCEHRLSEKTFGVPQMLYLIQKFRQHRTVLQPRIQRFVDGYESIGKKSLMVKVLEIVNGYDPECDEDSGA